MPRILPIPENELQPSVKVAFERHVREYNTSITNMKRTLGRSLLVFDTYMLWYPLYNKIENILGRRLAYLYAYTIAKASDCNLSATYFTKVLADAGENTDNLMLTEWQRDVLEFGKSIVKYKGNINDRLYDKVASQYTQDDMLILIAFTGQMIATTFFNNVVEIEVDEYLSHYSCADKHIRQ